jgi:oligopeptidase B
MTEPKPSPAPRAERRVHTHYDHGQVRPDPYAWLRDREDPAVLEHIRAENTFCEARLAGLEGLRKQLYQEFLGRIQETDSSVAAPHGPWEYYSRTEAGRAYPLHCRRLRGGGQEQILLDVNALGQGQEYVGVGMVHPSPDHAVLAFATDFTAAEQYTLRFGRLRAEDAGGLEPLDDRIENTSGTFAWASDSRTVWFCELDEAMRSHKVLRYTLGSGRAPEVMFHEPDERFRLAVARSRCGRWMLVTVYNAGTTEVRVCQTDDPTARPEPVFPRRTGAKYTVEAAGDSWFALTNVGADDTPGAAVNYRLVELVADGPPREWLAHRDDAELVSLDGFQDHLVVLERVRGQLGLRSLDLRSRQWKDLPLPETPSVVDLGTNLEFATSRFRFDYTSLTTPSTDFEVDLDTLATVRLKEQPVIGYDRTRYRTERMWATSVDGVRVPMSVVYRADLELRRGPHPTFLYGYGAYGITVDPVFSPSRVSLLDRGVVFVIAHVRGGGFLGRSWYEAGKLEHKQRSFDDFVACAKELITAGVSAPARLVACGGSAGGLLVGACMNRAPELFRGVLAQVPFVDVLSTMLDASLPLTAGEWDEWGDPRDPAVYERILAYSPYDNVQARAYPNLLATAGWTDPRVQYWEPVKWVAALRDLATSGEFLLRVQLSAGHQGRSGRYGALEERAFEYAWVLDQLTAVGPPAGGP